MKSCDFSTVLCYTHHLDFLGFRVFTTITKKHFLQVSRLNLTLVKFCLNHLKVKMHFHVAMSMSSTLTLLFHIY